MHLQLGCCKSSAPIINVAAKNIKSAGRAGFTQLERKLFKHLDQWFLTRVDRTPGFDEAVLGVRRKRPLKDYFLKILFSLELVAIKNNKVN